MVKMEQWDKIRRMYHIEGKSIRQIARETGYARETVAKLAKQQDPPKYKRGKEYAAPVLKPFKERLREMVRENENLPRKQRWTTPRMFEQLVTEGYQGAESTVRHYVGQIRKVEKIPNSYIPLSYDPGNDAQVDWGEAVVIIGGQEVTVQTFHMTMSYSRAHFMMAFPSQKQECFAAGHVSAFGFFGGIPRRISYDNLKTAVKEVLLGKDRIEQPQFIALRSYYRFDTHYCTPGAGHEKGIVEGMVGFGRRRYLSPPPEFADFAALNAFLLEKCRADFLRQVHGQPAPIGEMFANEMPNMLALPTHPFDCCRVVTVSRNRYSQVRLETNSYSLPTDVAGAQFTAKLYPFEVKIFAPNGLEPIATHPRSYETNQMVCDWHHYLPLLAQRPHAMPYARPLQGWQEKFPAIYGRVYNQLIARYPTGEGLKMFVELLCLHRKWTDEAMEAALKNAFAHGTVHLDGVIYWLNRAQRTEIEISAADLSNRAHLAEIGTQTVSAAHYDQLYGGV